ncbi:hypothetical protein ABZT17_40890 [Streptomyces sp. NPDC005648]|uniref:hypothetical protein n=1 Tax=Streptomyces sp. NPDC005648 TaxID=3157044 RepID=UPI0033BAB9B7
MDWETHARRLAADTVRPESRWYEPLATTPRHLLVPRWWDNEGGRWALRDGESDPEAWARAAYTDRALVTQVGPLHADHAEPETVTEGRPTSSSTLPGLVVTMYRHAMITDNSHVLVTTGTGYGTALACRRLGAELVTSVDVDAHLVTTARQRLQALGLRPHLAVCDITGPLPGEYDGSCPPCPCGPSRPPGWRPCARAGAWSPRSPEPGSSSPRTRPTTAAR